MRQSTKPFLITFFTFNILLFTCSCAPCDDHGWAGWHAYAQLRHDLHNDGWRCPANRRGDSRWSPSEISLAAWRRQASPRAWGRVITGWQADAQHILQQNNSEPDKLEYGSDQWHQEKKKLDAMIWASAIILILLFFGLALVTFIRIGRHYRQRVTEDKKPEPTEYVDAWSQYRLPEDNNSDDPKDA